MKLSISSLTFGILKLIFGPNEMLNWMHFFNWQKCGLNRITSDWGNQLVEGREPNNLQPILRDKF